MEKEAAARPGLCPYWYETKPSAKFRVARGQLFASLSRLAVLREEFLAVARMRDVKAALPKLESHVEDYYIRAYEIRERVRGLLAVLTRRRIEEFRNMHEYEAARAELRAADAELCAAVEAVLRLLRDDALVRNVHTHEQYLRLGFHTGSTVIDPQDTLVAVDGFERLQLENLLFPATRQCAEDYIEKVDRLMEAIQRVAFAVTRNPGTDIGSSPHVRRDGA